MSIGHCRLHFYFINVKFNNDAHLCFSTIFEVRARALVNLEKKKQNFQKKKSTPVRITIGTEVWIAQWHRNT